MTLLGRLTGVTGGRLRLGDEGSAATKRRQPRATEVVPETGAVGYA